MKWRLTLSPIFLEFWLALPLLLSAQSIAWAATITNPKVTVEKRSSQVHSSAKSKKSVKRRTRQTRKATYRRRHTRRHYERFVASSYATNQTVGDQFAGEDPAVRESAIAALGNLNGTVVVINPNNGRILAMVNQKLALSGGAEPCSTIKLSVALAALEEGVIQEDTPVDLGRRHSMTLTHALAFSNNLYFETVGRRLGFERVKHYANLFGLGELAGYHIHGEQLGIYPDHVLAASKGGVGRMCSFGESVSVTPLQLGALIAAIANGGTLYYLQHPQTEAQVAEYEPHIKRQLNIGPVIPAISNGMSDVVKFGTGRGVLINFTEFPVLGKTGTCSNRGTRFGWFGSFADTPYGQLVTVILLEGGSATYGPKAAEVAGVFYHNLQEKHYYVTMRQEQPGRQISSIPVK